MSDRVAASKFLSLLLRHKPEAVGLHLDDEGWALISDVVRLTASSQTPLSRALIEALVRDCDKQRFRISDDGSRIRANQGHSVPVALGLSPSTPPQWLYHGTVARFLDSIRREGLARGARQQVHLSADMETARRVAERRGPPVILMVDADRMRLAGHLFYRSDNGVWLVDAVPPAFLMELEPASPTADR